jgi:predicted Zn-ribbon and HTH transcriptional regulator
MISQCTRKIVFVNGEFQLIPLTIKQRERLGKKEEKELERIKAIPKPVKVAEKKPGNCKACDGYGYFPRLFEDNTKCPHCDINGNRY